MANVIPHIQLFIELDQAMQPILEVLEPLYGYLYDLSTKTKKEKLKPSGFYFLLEPNWSISTGLDVMIDLYKNVNLLLLVISEIEEHQSDFLETPNIHALVSTSKALKNNIFDISSIISKIKDGDEVIGIKSACKKLFLYTESVRALVEEFIPLKDILLEESLNDYNILLTKEPLDLKGDLE